MENLQTIEKTRPEYTKNNVAFNKSLTKTILFAILIVSILTTVYFFTAGLINPESQLLVVILAFSLVAIISGLSISQINEENHFLFLLGVLLVINLAFIALATVFQGIGLITVILIILTSVSFSSAFFIDRGNSGIIVGIIAGALAVILNLLTPLPQLVMPSVNIILPALIVLIAIGLLTLTQLGIVTSNLRINLVVISLAITIIPLITISIVQSSYTRNLIENQTNQSLLLAGNQVAARLDEFISLNRDAVSKEAVLPVFSSYILTPPDKRVGSPQEQELILTLKSLKSKENSQFYNYGLLNLQGKNIYDTNIDRIGNSEATADYFVQPLRNGQVYISEIRFDDKNKPYLYFSMPIRDGQNQLIGVLRLEYDALILQHIIEEYMNLIGERSYPMLVNNFYLRIADTLTPNDLYKTIIPLRPEDQNAFRADRWLPEGSTEEISTNFPDFAAIIDNAQSNPFFLSIVREDDDGSAEHGAIVPLSNHNWFVVFLQEESAYNTNFNEQSQLLGVSAALISAVIGLIATLVAGLFSRPISDLNVIARKISAGELSARTKVTSSDEIGILGSTFNAMAERLQTVFSGLEDKVKERTQELAKQNETLLFRGSQLQTVAEVARNIVSTQDLESFLNDITALISTRFDFYHVGIFLLDDKKEYAILRAANSEGGKRMLAREHKLKVGQVGIVGHATGTGEPRIATDVGQDATYFDNPDLPLTRSEMALPLKSNNEIIGALDVQSTLSNAFTKEDIELFSTLSDQVAVAILNNRLFTETRAALEEAQQVHRQYLQKEWQTDIQERHNKQIVFSDNKVEMQPRNTSIEIDTVIKSGETIVQSQKLQDHNELVLYLPIKLRGQTIGVIKLRDLKSTKQTWSSDEISAVESIADQVGLALENARLFEQTQRRANRERKALEITSKIRATNDPQEMIQIAMNELKNALGTSKAQIILDTYQVDNTELSNNDEIIQEEEIEKAIPLSTIESPDPGPVR
ncbi:MAG: hypothetical protein CVU39_05765 [Chloroflexi bacterium HGW-Chloroflexi-10]|nr:MAG: hypothetical protein CVU39_05765 [Chloroflexi bacterium HGW-Chloroflexi-10]